MTRSALTLIASSICWHRRRPPGGPRPSSPSNGACTISRTFSSAKYRPHTTTSLFQHQAANLPPDSNSGLAQPTPLWGLLHSGTGGSPAVCSTASRDSGAKHINDTIHQPSMGTRRKDARFPNDDRLARREELRGAREALSAQATTREGFRGDGHSARVHRGCW
jgi:hypothetical protein